MPFHRNVSFLIVLGVLTLLITFGLLQRSQYPSPLVHGGCRMTYSMPNYLHIRSLRETKRGYKLFLFRDGEFDRNMQLYGTPVLFIHGNAGSYKQVRSLAKVSSERAHDSKGPGLDFFAADFQEEFSALTGELLLKQAEYINDCISHILKLYIGTSDKIPAPTSVLVIGHSMGGVAARAAFRLPNYSAGSINTIITLATPHTDARVCLEKGMWDFYRDLNGFWAQNFASPDGKGPLQDVALISINGGDADEQIAADLTEVDTTVPKGHGFTVSTMSLPKCWVSVEHQVIVWCNQVAESIVTALHAVVLPHSPSRTLPLVERMEVFSHHLLEAPSLPAPRVFNQSYATVSPGRFKTAELAQDIGLSIEQGLAVTSSLSVAIYTCRGVGGDLQCQDISPHRILVPASNIHMDPEFGNSVYYFWEVPASDATLYIRKPPRSAKEDFVLISPLPAAPRLVPTLWGLMRGFVHTLPEHRVAHWQFRLPDSPLLVYTLRMQSPLASTPVILQQIDSLVNERKVWVSSTDNSPISISFHGSNAGGPGAALFRHGLIFRLWNGLPARREPDAPHSVRISLQLDIPGTLGRLLRRLDVAAVVFPFLVFLLVFRLQLQRLSQFGAFPSFLSSLRHVFQNELLYWMVLGCVLTIAQDFHRSPSAIAENSPLHSRNWLLGSWGAFAAWCLPLTILVATGWLVMLFAMYRTLGLVLRPFSPLLGKLPLGAKWIVGGLLFLPHPIVHVLVLVGLIIQSGPTAALSPKLNLQPSLGLLLFFSLPCHFPWLIAFFQSVIRGIFPDHMYLSNLLSIPLVLTAVYPVSAKELQRALLNPFLAFCTQTIVILASLGVLVWGLHAAFIIPYICTIILGWLWVIAFFSSISDPIKVA